LGHGYRRTLGAFIHDQSMVLAITPLAIEGNETIRAMTIRARTCCLSRGLVAGIATLVAGAFVSTNIGAEESGASMTCTNLVSGVSWQISINFAESTVDSNPARISGTQISWHDGADGGNYTLDRKSGELTVIFASSTGGYFIHDRCTLEK
jgi:hypothetical protein